MNILVIDDLRIFDDFPENTVYARTLDEGILQISFYPWDEVYLDHDLSEDETIRPLVRVLAEAAFLGHPYNIKQFYVCSDNAPGIEWIIGTLEKYYPIMYRQPRFHVDWNQTPA